jgi:hypothetical protein
LGGRFVIKVPDGVPIETPPATVSDLITSKAQGLLVFYAGYTRIATDDLLDVSGVDTVNSTNGIFGSRSSIILQPGGIFQSLPVTLTGGAPPAAIITWDTFDTLNSDVSTATTVQQYNELPSTPSNVTCEVSFNGGSTFLPAFDSSPVGVSVPNQGTSFIIKLTNASVSRLSIGSWSCIY